MAAPEELFARFRQHADADALAAVFDALAPSLLLVAAHVAPAGCDAEDLVQATFLGAMEDAARWDAARPLMPWLIGILIHRAHNARRLGSRRIDAARLPQPAEPSPLDALAASEVAEQVATGLASLPRQLRQTLSLRLVHGLTPTEIAHALGCPVATAKTRLQRGMDWLRKVLPAGIAVSVAGVITTGRGLAAVRAVVLGKAKVAAVAGAATAGVAAGVIAGGLAMKQVVIATVAVLCIAALWVLVPRPDEPARADVASLPQPKLVQASDPKASAQSPADPAAASNDRVAVSPGTPLGSMQLEFVWKGYDRPAGHVQFWWRDGDEPTDLHRCYADAQGRIRIPDLPPADYLVSTLANPRVPPLTVRAGQETKARIELEPGLRVDGMVVDKDGRGVAGAAVYARGFNGLEDDDSRLVAVCRQDGSFHGCTDRSGSFWAQKPGFVPSAPVENKLFGAVQLQFVLREVGCALRGTAVDAQGRGRDRVRITIARTSPRSEVAAPLTLVTDAAGTFATDELAPGEHLLLARADGLAPSVSSFTSTANKAARLVVRLGAGATLTGSVVDEAGQPVLALIHAQLTLPGELDASIAALQPLRQLCEFRVGSPAGSYRLEHLPAAYLLLQANSPGKVAFSQLLQLQEGEVRRCDLVLRAGGEIRGRIEDADGEPLANWNIDARTTRRAHVGFARSAADGTFALQGLPADEYLLAATPSYDCKLRAAPVKARLGETDVVLRTSCTEAQLGRFTFRVLDAAGAPIGNVGVWIDSLDQLGNTQYTTWSPSGSYRTQALPPGRHELGVIAPDQARLRLGVRELPPGATVDLGTVRMPKSGTMELRFDGANGQAVAPDEVSARDDAGNVASLTRGADGVYRSQPLPAGSYRATAWGASIAPVAQEALVVGDRATLTGIAVVATTPVTFVLPRPESAGEGKWTAQVRLVLATADGVKLADRMLEIDTEQALGWTRGLLPGSYTYEATLRPDGEPVRGAFTVTAGGPQCVEVRLPAKTN